jgi:excisionase family DNA binding protein
VVTSIVLPEVKAAARRFLDVKEVGARLGCSWRHVLRLADRGAMPPGIKLGALRRWDADQLEAWIADGCKPVRPTTSSGKVSPRR